MSEIPSDYRRNVAIFLLNEQNQILLCERSDFAGAWQLPQGGIDDGESVEQAALRELLEEVGTNNAEVLLVLPESCRYEWPETLYVRGFRGQEQYYLLARLQTGAVLNFATEHPEFVRSEWVGQQIFLNRLSGFKAEAYRKALHQINRLRPNLLAP